MPLTPTPRMKLPRPSGSDPFKRQNFIDLADRMDLYPGIRIATGSDPAAGADWGSAQSGMLMVREDTGQVKRWDGNSWERLENYTRIFQGNLVPGGSVNTIVGQTRTYELIASVPVVRDCVMNIIITGVFSRTINQPDNAGLNKQMTLLPRIGGTTAKFGADHIMNFASNADDDTEGEPQQYTVLGRKQVSAGNHAVDIQATTNNNTKIKAHYLHCFAMLSEQ